MSYSRLGEYENSPGPNPPAKAHTKLTIPIYNPLFLIENKSLMQILQRVMMPPPPVPCTARAKINIPMLTLTPAINDPMKNTPTADNSTTFRPQISDILPQEGAAAALARRYAEPIHVYPAVDFSSSEMVGIATVTMVVSRAERKTAEQSEIMMRAFWSGVRSASGGVTLLPFRPWAAGLVAVAAAAAESGTSCGDGVVVVTWPSFSVVDVVVVPSFPPNLSCPSAACKVPIVSLATISLLLLVVEGVFVSLPESGESPGSMAIVICIVLKAWVSHGGCVGSECGQARLRLETPDYLIPHCPETGG